MTRPIRRRRGRAAGARVAALALAALGALGRPGAARAQEVAREAQGADVAAVAFDGARAFSSAVLQAAIETAPPRCLLPLCLFGLASDRQQLDLETLRADVLRLRLFYFQHGYRQARVEVATSPQRRGVRVAFQIVEGSPVRVGSLELTGADSILPRDVLQGVLQPGDPFGTLAYEAARDTLLNRLADRGYAHAQVLAGYDLPRDSAGHAALRFEVVPGPLARFDTIRVTGTKHIDPAVIRRMLTFQPGDPYSQDKIVRSQRNLFALEVFRHVEIQPDLDAPGDSLVPVTVDVREGDLHRVRYGVGINTVEALNAEGRWTARNFFGGARRLELRARISNVLAGPLQGLPFMEANTGKYAELNGSLTADFLQPWFYSALNTFGAGLFAERQSFPGIFIESTQGAYVTLNRNLGGGASIALGFRPQLTELTADDDRIFCLSLTICDQQTQEREIKVLSTPHWLAPLTVSYTRDHSNALFAPTNGSIFHFDGEYASHATGSAFAYWRAVAELSEYRQLIPGLVLAVRVRPGLARSLSEPAASQGLGLYPQRRFFAGGPNSVRGFAQYQLGPKVLTVDAVQHLIVPRDSGGAGCTSAQVNDGSCLLVGADGGSLLPASDFDVHPVGGAALLEGNFELRFPLGGNFRGAAFVDAGQLWPTTNDFRLRGLVWTPGLGVRYFSAIGPVRVDVGYNPQGAQPLTVLTTEVGVKQADGSCGDGPAADPSRPRPCDFGSLHPLQPLRWPLGNRFLDHLQLHFSIGQAF